MADETTIAGDSAGGFKTSPPKADPPSAETTGPAEGSDISQSKPSAPATPPSEPEAHIIEETIVRPAPLEKKVNVVQTLLPTGGQADEQRAIRPDSLTGPAPTKTELAPVKVTTPIALQPAPVITFRPASALPGPALARVAESPKPLPVPSVGTPAPNSAAASLSPPVAPPHTAETFQKEREVISHILEDAKLPERREAPGQPKISTEQRVFDTALGASAKESTTPIAESPKVPGDESARVQEGSPIKQTSSLASVLISPLRTLKKDLQDIVRDKKISLVRAAALESDKRGRSNILRGEVVRERSHRTFGILFAAVLLFVLGGAAFFGVFIIMQERAGIPPRDSSDSIVFAESTYAFPVGNSSSLDLKRILARARGGGSATLGSITHIVPVVSETNAEGDAIERPATLEEFLQALGTRASPDLIRALSSYFFFGLHTVDENAPLFVIPVLSYERAFAGMLAWEGTLNADLSPAFSAVPDQIRGAGGLPEKRRFEDVIMRNYDVRALKDDAGSIQLYYSFPTQHLLVIGESPYSFTEILSRLRAERKL